MAMLLLSAGALQCSMSGAKPGVGLESMSTRSKSLALSNSSVQVWSDGSKSPELLVYKYLKNARRVLMDQ